MKITILLLLLITSVFAGDEERIGTTRHLFIHAGQLQAYNSVGFSSILASDAAELASGNPAAIANFSRMTLGAAFDYRTPVEWYSDIELSKSLSWRPVSAALVVPLKYVHLGLTYQNKYSAFIDFGEFEVTTPTEPDGTGEFYNSTSETNVHSFGAIIGAEFQKLILDRDRLAFAVQFSADYFYAVDKIWHTSGTLSDFASGVKMGLLYNLNPAIGIGFLFESVPDFEGKYKYEPELAYPSNSTIKVPFADKMAFGLQLRPIRQISIATAWEYVFYEQVHSNNNNALNFSIGVIYRIPGLFDLSAGMYESKQSFKDSYSPDRDAVFFNLGIRKRFRSGDIWLEVYDSHYFSNEMRQQTLVKLGFNIALQQNH